MEIYPSHHNQGQLFIFYTIREFGAITFTIIMTVRMGLSILFSCAIYGHRLKPMALVGVALVFASIFGRIFLGERDRRLKPSGKGAPELQIAVDKGGKLPV